jgi:hypothetical protein
MLQDRNVHVLMLVTDNVVTPFKPVVLEARTAIGFQVPAANTFCSTTPSDVRTTLKEAVQLRLLFAKVDDTLSELIAMLGVAGGGGLGDGLFGWRAECAEQ